VEFLGKIVVDRGEEADSTRSDNARALESSCTLNEFSILNETQYLGIYLIIQAVFHVAPQREPSEM
jgi:hypothetical protein